MVKKNKIYDVLLVGSGLSSLSFIDSYLEKNNFINVISPQYSKKQPKKNRHIFKLLPPQMMNSENEVNNYFYYNKINVNRNCNIFGSLEFGGLSNYWGLQIDNDILGDIKYLKYSTKKKISKSFVELFKKFNLLGRIKLDNKTLENSYKKNKFFHEKFIKKNKDLLFEDPTLAFQKKNKNKINLDNINESAAKLTPKNVFRKYFKNKKIKLHNYYVKKIKKHKKGLLVVCSNETKEKSFITKKLVLGCGTIITTKLILDFLKIFREVKINHHPRLLCLYLSKKRWKNKMIFQPSDFHLKSKKQKDLFTADFRPGNDLIIDAVTKFKKILFPFKFILNLIKQNLIFSNILFNSKYGSLYLKLNKNNKVEIYSKNKNINYLFKRSVKMVYNFLRSTKMILPFKYSYFPAFGSDVHYFGTIPFGGKKLLSVNENCQLSKSNNIYVIDGSVFNFKKNKYPLGIIMANSRRVAKDI